MWKICKGYSAYDLGELKEIDASQLPLDPVEVAGSARLPKLLYHAQRLSILFAETALQLIMCPSTFMKMVEPRITNQARRVWWLRNGQTISRRCLMRMMNRHRRNEGPCAHASISAEYSLCLRILQFPRTRRYVGQLSMEEGSARSATHPRV